MKCQLSMQDICWVLEKAICVQCSCLYKICKSRFCCQLNASLSYFCDSEWCDKVAGQLATGSMSSDVASSNVIYMPFRGQVADFEVNVLHDSSFSLYISCSYIHVDTLDSPLQNFWSKLYAGLVLCALRLL